MVDVRKVTARFPGIRRRATVLVLVGLMLLALVPLQPGMGAPGDTIEVKNPNGGEVLAQGQIYNIRWMVSDTGGFLHLGYSIDGGINFTGIDTISNRILILPRYSWRVPFGINSTKCILRIGWTEFENPKLGKVYSTDDSNANFTIAPGLAIAFKDIPSVMTYGKYYPISWEFFDTCSTVAGIDMEFRAMDDTTWTPWSILSPSYAGIPPHYPYHFFTPPQYQEARGQLRLVARESLPSGPVVGYAFSPEFDINSAIVVLTSPNGGETVVMGETLTIEWQVVNDPGETITGVALDYSLDDGDTWHIIHSSLPMAYDFDWFVPTTLTLSFEFRIRVILYYIEFSHLAEDVSDGPNSLIPDRSVLTLSLTDPNPPVTGNYIQGGTMHEISWSITGSTSDILRFDVYWSMNSGASWNSVASATATETSHDWDVPVRDYDTCRIRVVLVKSAGPPHIIAISNNDFWIYSEATFNIPPRADAGEDQRVDEFDRVYLDGTASADSNLDPLTYFWSVVDDGGFNVSINDNSSATAWFTTDIEDYEYTMIFQLEVDDGMATDPTWLWYTDRVLVTVRPAPPEIVGFRPSLGWAGTTIIVQGRNCAGATILLDETPIGTFPTLYADGTDLPITLHDEVPVGTFPVTVRTMAGDSDTVDEFEVFHAPDWTWENGLPFRNPADHFLSYPWDFTAARGNYRTTFGDVIYIPIWICIGIPWYDPWNGWVCLGYEIDTPSGIPDPLAALYYGSFYCWIGRMGQCFGMSILALQFMNGDRDLEDFNETATRVNQLDQFEDGTLDHWVESMQGSQLSLEILDHYLWEFAAGLIFSSPGPPATGLHRVIEQVEDSIAGGELGVISMVTGGNGHAVVPYHVEHVGDRTRIYVYDCNREYFSFSNESNIPTRYSDPDNRPPYIEIDEAGGLWTWTFEHAGGETWSDTVGLVFCPYDKVNGPRTLPTDFEGLVTFLVGDASCAVSNEAGDTMEWNSDGSLTHDIEGAAPLPNFQGLGDSMNGWMMDHWGNYTTTVTGLRDAGVYNWTQFVNGDSAYALQMSGVSNGATEELDLEFDGNVSLQGRFTYDTSETSKTYSYTQIKRMGDPASDEGRIRQRVYRVVDATLHGDARAIINTTHDYQSLVFENNGPHTLTFGVEFQTNVMGSEAWDALGGTMPDSLPTASRNGITIEPYQRLVITPSNWLDLNNAEILIEGETGEYDPPGQPSRFLARSYGSIVRCEWSPPADDGGSPITQYILYRGDTFASMNQYRSFDASDPMVWTDMDVVLSSTYFYAIAAVNVAGVGPKSPAIGVFVTQDPATPDPPLNMVATVADGKVTLTWDPPEWNGGADITGFTIMRSEESWTSSPPTLETVGSISSFEDATVEGNTTYYYWIDSINSVGRSAPFGPVEVHTPPRTDGGDGDGDGDGDGGTPAWQWLVAIVVLILLFILAMWFGYLRDR